ncbi:DUF2515 family protein [Paenibacillus sp. Marseille-Q4541]|uniref:DUF2515 family protein n=1 Tax=Paenibacillus sp. Marseille-Q4541 TaxID=2831522 RepID=UPI0032D5AB18
MNNQQSSMHPFRSIWQMVKTMPLTIAEVIRGKRAAILSSNQLRHPLRIFSWPTSSAIWIQNELEHTMASVHACGVQPVAFRGSQLDPYSVEELEIVREIMEQTQRHNQSNLTRTAAYLACYEAYPELHWALLAHFVSRNGGYNMTDLKSELLQNVLKSQDNKQVYLLLERCNALIFQDAYPQLLLYMKSRENGRSYFHLLSEFHVSAFMSPFWEQFWLERNSEILTVGLIINEQNYIENRVIRNPYYQHHVMSTLSFRSHELAGLNHIIIPLGVDQELVGLTITHFNKLHERIEFGKTLYALLFGYSQVLTRASAYASEVPHEGSRSEYWPKYYTSLHGQKLEEPILTTVLSNREVLPDGNKLYSPTLYKAWYDMPYEKITREDWLTHTAQTDTLGHLNLPRRPRVFDVSHQHRFALWKLGIIHDLNEIRENDKLT